MPADYRVVAEAIRAQIRAGRLAPGDRLPGVRELAAQHDASRDSAAAAIRLLAADGWLIVERRHATRVAAVLPAESPTVAELAADVADLRSRVKALEDRDR